MGFGFADDLDSNFSYDDRNCLCNTVISSMALYMRAHKEEPMLVVSLVVAILSAFYFNNVQVECLLDDCFLCSHRAFCFAPMDDNFMEEI